MTPWAWDDERLAQAQQWEREGLSAAEIAVRFGQTLPGVAEPTRNAVAGKLHRKRGGPHDPAQTKARQAAGAVNGRSAPSAIRQVAAVGGISASAWRAARGMDPFATPKPLPRLREAAVAPLMVSLLELAPRSCRWPYEVAGEARFCGHRAPGGRYCDAHGRLSADAAATAAANAAARRAKA